MRWSDSLDAAGLAGRVAAYVTKSPEVAAEVRARAEIVRDYWRDIAPVFGDKPPKRAAPAYGKPVGYYRDSIEVEPVVAGRTRVGTYAYNAGFLEYGSIHNPEHGYGARVLAHFGGTKMSGEQ